MMQQTEIIKKLGDANFQAALLASPKEALHKAGVEVPATTEVKVVRNSKDVVNIAIPANNVSDTVLSDDQLGQLSAGEIVFSLLIVGVVAGGAIVVGGVTASVVTSGS